MQAKHGDATRFDAAIQYAKAIVSQASGHRIGLIPFASQAYIHTPLTLDHAYIQASLDALKPIDAWPGTDLSEAILAAYRGFLNQTGSPVLLLLSDGNTTAGDTQSRIRLAQTLGIRIITVGIGTDHGEPIPTASGFLREADRIVISTIQRDTLRHIAQQTQGRYSESPAMIYPALWGTASASIRDQWSGLPLRTAWLYAAGLFCLFYSHYQATGLLLFLLLAIPGMHATLDPLSLHRAEQAYYAQQQLQAYPPAYTAPDRPPHHTVIIWDDIRMQDRIQGPVLETLPTNGSRH
jgi:von Willebrand factor type A domain.